MRALGGDVHDFPVDACDDEGCDISQHPYRNEDIHEIIFISIIYIACWLAQSWRRIVVKKRWAVLFTIVVIISFAYTTQPKEKLLAVFKLEKQPHRHIPMAGSLWENMAHASGICTLAPCLAVSGSRLKWFKIKLAGTWLHTLIALRAVSISGAQHISYF